MKMIKMMKQFAWAAAMIALSSAALAKEADKVARFDPVKRELRGWTVHVDPQLLKGGVDAEEGAKALSMLDNHLERIALLMPKKQLAELKKLEIWIERKHPTLSSMQYHPSKEWLVENGHDPRLEKMVHIPVAANLLSRQQILKHPAVILHELAHSYHDQVLGFEHEGILAAYKKAMDAGSYDKALLYTGEVVRHYGATNHKEYFSESTEAYFYHNDFYPFVRAELKKHDPTAFALMEKIWGKVD